MLKEEQLLLEGIEQRSLAPNEFTHRSHLRLAYIYCCYFPLEEALSRCTKGIKAYAESLGAHQKYHHTLTVAAVLLVRQRLSKQRVEGFEELITANPDLVANFKGALAEHYSAEHLENPEAKQLYLPPDRSPFVVPEGILLEGI